MRVFTPPTRIICAWLLLGCALSVHAQALPKPAAAPHRPSPPMHPTGSRFPPVTSVPFRYDPLLAPYVIVQVKINGHKALPFIVDTGSSFPLVLNPWAAQELKLPVSTAKAAQVEIQGRPPGKLLASPVTVEVVGEDPRHSIRLVRLPAVVTDFSTYTRIAGIIGNPCLRASPHFAFQLDFVRQALRVCRVPDRAASDASLTVLPLQARPVTADSSKDSLWYWATLPLGDGPVQFVFDTGSPFSGVAGLGALPSLRARAAKVLSPAQTGYAFSDALLLPPPGIGGVPQPAMVIRNEFAPYPTLLGLDFLSHFLVTLDLAHDRLLLERPGGRDAPRLPGGGDVAVWPQGGGYTVIWVVPGSPADRAGVRAGDVLTAADGQPLSSLTPSLVQPLVDGFAGTAASLTIRRGSAATTTVRYVRRGLFDGSRDATQGLILTLIDNHLRMGRVTPGCLGDKLGMEAGDEVVSVNGKAVPVLMSGSLMTELNSAEADLMVQRKDGPLLEYHLPADPALVKVPPEPPPTFSVLPGHWSWYPNASWAAVP